jgi:ribosomal-protein-alanine N-acetyltransferase
MLHRTRLEIRPRPSRPCSGRDPLPRTSNVAFRSHTSVGELVRIDAMRRDDVAAVAAIDGTAPGREEDFRGELDRPWSHSWVARDERGEAVAFVVVWHVVDEIHVLHLATRVDRQRQGIGRLLMDEVIAFARRKHAEHLLLEVRRTNRPALGLYRSLGFFASGVRARYYADDEDAIEMILAFDPATGDVARRADEVSVEST